MRNNDFEIKSREEYRQQMHKAVRENDPEAFAQAWDGMCMAIGEGLKQDYTQQINALQEELDNRVLTARGVRQLTGDEKQYYQKVMQAMSSKDPKQALASLDVTMPPSIIESVFDDLKANHPLLSHIDFMPSGGAVELIMNENGYQEAAWGTLCAEVVKELTSGFKKVSANLLKLSAFLPVCKAMLALGPTWLDRYVREVLYEALANGLESGIVNGTGKEMPIGMNRQVGAGVTITDGVYPEKVAIAVEDLSPQTVGDLLAQLAVDPNGKARRIQNVVMIVNPVDYYKLIMPATTVISPDGTYRNNVMPYPVTIIESPAVAQGKAIFGLAKRYFGVAGTSIDGTIDYSDHYHYLEDERMYLIKVYANGMPKDNAAFLVLDISGLKPLTLKVEMVSGDSAAAATADEGAE